MRAINLAWHDNQQFLTKFANDSLATLDGDNDDKDNDSFATLNSNLDVMHNILYTASASLDVKSV